MRRMSEDGPWTIDEFARIADTTVRNVRLYQQRGLIPPPERQGRERARYGDDHLRRLRLVLTLLRRGYPLAAIRELIDAWEGNRRLSDVLGFEEALAEPFTSEPPRTFTLDELQQLFPDDDGTGLARSVELGLLVADGDAFIAPVPALIEVGAELVADGVPLFDVIHVAKEVRDASQHLADVFVQLFIDSTWSPFVAAGEPPEGWQALTDALNRRRQVWPRVVLPTLAHALEQQVDEAARNITAEELRERAARSDAGERAS
ncbi:MAG: transcriptional regulator, MerR family [Actinomycetia bacterium]|nr:transcriptional regulator, MerR family [Actinomycetes bacterium]